MPTASELTKMQDSELQEKLLGLQKERFEMQMLVRTNSLKNNQLVKKLRHDIARIKTVLHARLLAKNNARAD